jgi:hypothetical protein
MCFTQLPWLDGKCKRILLHIFRGNATRLSVQKNSDVLESLAIERILQGFMLALSCPHFKFQIVGDRAASSPYTLVVRSR